MNSINFIHTIRKHKATKVLAVFLAIEMFYSVLHPSALYALTSGPTQPEVEGFTPIGVTDMVDPFTGDFSYNIPLLQVGDYPLNLAYNSGSTMEDEASWAGFGWNVHTGVINRQLRGLPDDFNGDNIVKIVNQKDNVTVGAKIMMGFESFGLDLEDLGLDLSAGVDVNYNNYAGVGLSTSTSAGLKLPMGSSSFPLNLGLSLSAGPDGLNIAPNLSFSMRSKENSDKASGSMTMGFGMNINSRSGLSNMSLNAGASVSQNRSDPEIVNKKQKSHMAEADASGSISLVSSNISLGSPTYTPSIGLPMKNIAFTGSFKLGASTFGQDFDGTISAYASVQKLAKNRIENPAYGYNYMEEGQDNRNALLDYNREKDGSYSKEKKNLALVNSTHDLYSINAQGLGGMFRAHRNDAGHIFDAYANSISESFDFGVELSPGNIVDFGANINANILESESGRWSNSNQAAEKLRFQKNQINNLRENVHFKMSGEMSVEQNPEFLNNILTHNPASIKITGQNTGFEVVGQNRFTQGSSNFQTPIFRKNRQKRNTAIYHLTAKQVRNAYPWKAGRVSKYAKDHHIAEIIVIQPDGKRFVFGLAAYNSIQKEQSFNVGKRMDGQTLLTENQMVTSDNQGFIQSQATQSVITPSGGKWGLDHFYEEVQTPAYAHSWLLTEILSADYVDLTGDGPTVDDLGTYTAFTYGNNDNKPTIENFPWRTPTLGVGSAAYMRGLKSDVTDDKGSIISGLKDVFYVHSIRSKTQIAVFETSDRNDALGANQNGNFETSKRLQKLDVIKLFSLPEYQNNPALAVPVKSVHFVYDYSAWPETPNVISNTAGKLTLTKVYFTYKNSTEGQFSPYEFEYAHEAGDIYRFGDNDRWGTYRRQEDLPSGINATRADYPYADQNKNRRDKRAAAWNLNKIILPSGGSIKIDYETDDYAYVQNKNAMQMFRVVGFIQESEIDSWNSPNNNFIDINPEILDPFDKEYVVVKLDQPVSSDVEFREKYLKESLHGQTPIPIKQLYFRACLNVNKASDMSDGDYEYISGYCNIADLSECGLLPNSNQLGYIKLKPVSTKFSGIDMDVNPFMFAAWQFSRLYTPKKAFNQPEVGDDAISSIVQTLANANIIGQIINFFRGPNLRMFNNNYGKYLDTGKSWVRLSDPNMNKLGGGSRVKKILINDNWGIISPSETSAEYGQEFSYINADGSSSGVAAYEPMIGADENPFRMPVFYSSPKKLLVPDERYYIEEPFGECYFPSPSIGYSRVVIKDYFPSGVNTKNKTGYAIHEFYTAKDFPTKTAYTSLEFEIRKTGFLETLIGSDTQEFTTVSQGYSVFTNDMHGKKKQESLYKEEESTPFSYTKYFYKTDNAGKQLNNKISVVDKSGYISEKLVGTDIDFMADMREQSTLGQAFGVNFNLATFIVGVPPFPIPIPTLFTTNKFNHTRFRSAVTTKLVYQYGIQDSVVTYDRGAIVSTKTVALDAETGLPIIQKLTNEYKDSYFKTDYPAHWAYPGMDQASRNIGFTFSTDKVNGLTGKIQNTDNLYKYLQPGDEVIPDVPFYYKGNAYGNANTNRFWVAKHFTTDNLGKCIPGDLYLIKNTGETVVKSQDCATCSTYTVIRSGHRNQQSSSIGSYTTTKLAIHNNVLSIDANDKVIAASALEYSEKWSTKAGFMKPVNISGKIITYDIFTNRFIRIFNYLLEHYQTLQPSGPVSLNSIDFYPVLLSMLNQLDRKCIENVQSIEAVPGTFTNDSVCSLMTNKPQLSFRFTNSSTDPERSCCEVTLINPNNNLFSWNQIQSIEETTFINPQIPSDESLYNCVPSYTNINSTYYAIVDVTLNSGDKSKLILSTRNCHRLIREVETYNIVDYVCSIDTGTVVNPYLYGLLGNWRPKLDYFYMTDRNNNNPMSVENLRTDGYFSSYSSFWVYNGTEELYKNNLTTQEYDKWNYKNAITQYSPYGYEVENVNKANIHSSAQYGYLNTLPVSVAANAQYKEIAFDGFEDYYPTVTMEGCVRDYLNHFYFRNHIQSVSTDEAHTGTHSIAVNPQLSVSVIAKLTPAYSRFLPCPVVPFVLTSDHLLRGFSPNSAVSDPQKYIVNFWVKLSNQSPYVLSYESNFQFNVRLNGTPIQTGGAKTKIISGWQQFEYAFIIPSNSATGSDLSFELINTSSNSTIYMDDFRSHPQDANMKSYVYDVKTLQYMAQLDENNFATFFEYDPAGKLVRTKKETERGIMTITENRSNMYKRVP